MVNLICLHDEIRLVTKIHTFIVVFFFVLCFFFSILMTMTMFKIKKKQNSFQILVHIQIWNFFSISFSSFFILIFHRVPSASLVESTQIEGGRRGSALVRPIRSASCLDLLCRVLSSCSHFLLPVCEWGGARVLSASSTQGRQGQSFGYVHIHGRSMAFQHTAALFPQV